MRHPRTQRLTLVEYSLEDSTKYDTSSQTGVQACATEGKREIISLDKSYDSVVLLYLHVSMSYTFKYSYFYNSKTKLSVYYIIELTVGDDVVA